MGTASGNRYDLVAKSLPILGNLAGGLSLKYWLGA